MRSTQTIGLATLLTLAVVAVAAPPTAATPTCHDSLCCRIYETAKLDFATCVVCVSADGYWDAEANRCFFP